VAAWGLAPDVVRTVVGGTKRSPVYRGIRAQLSSPCPTDVWIEDRRGFVQYELEQGPHLAWVVFVVDLHGGDLVTAKCLCPDDAGEQITVTDLTASAV